MDSRLYRVVKSGNVYILLQLLNENPRLLTKLTPQGNTPLHIAVQFGHKGVVVEIYNRCRSLLTRPNSSGDSPLHVAARCGHFSIVDFLVKEVLSAKRISTENGKTGRFDILRQGNKENNTVLHEAVRNGNMSVVKLLLRVDTKLACFENYAGESPLFLAAREGKKDVLSQILISTPASAHGGSEGQTALHAAVIERHSDIMEILLRAKPHLITEADHHGRTALHYAASLGDRRANIIKCVWRKLIPVSNRIIGKKNPPSCIIFWGAISNDESYVYYLASATLLTCIALQSAAIAFLSGIVAVLPDQPFVDSVSYIVGIAFHASNFLFLLQLLLLRYPKHLVCAFDEPLESNSIDRKYVHMEAWNHIVVTMQCPDRVDFMDSRLYRVAKSGNVYILLQLLNENPRLLTKLTPQGNTPLHIAVQFGHKGVVVEIYNRCRSLLTRPNSSGDSPLHVAARCGHFSIVDFLVKEVLSAERISTENGKTGRFDILRQGNKENNTVLHEAVRNGNMSVVKLLLRVDTKLACFENYAGESPLFLAAREGKKDVLSQILISTPASAHGGSEGQTALHAAVIERHSDIMEILLRAKPHLITEADHHGRTALHYAASLGDRRAVERLLEVDECTAYVLDKNGHSPLHVAARNGHADVIERIIHYCPDSGELLDLNGRSVLHFAVLSGKVNVVRCVAEIAELQWLINQADNGGNTPLHLAAIERQTRILRCLIWDERVDHRARNENGQSVFDIDGSIRESCFIYRCNIIKCVWRKLITVSNRITGKKNPPYAIAMTSSIIAACIIFWGAVSNDESYVYYLASATVLTCIALQSAGIAFLSGIVAALPDQPFVDSVIYIVGIAFHVSNFLFLLQLTLCIPLQNAVSKVFGQLLLRFPKHLVCAFDEPLEMIKFHRKCRNKLQNVPLSD
ncbi:hypothetical protein NC652_028302 [Populus alba x Populus x berolinensis]|nr:hypothetical protein NC652_028302 [Populus alba x Populus x berolinensis]